MRKTMIVAIREYNEAVKTKAFIIGLLAMPVLMGGGIAVQFLLRDKVDTKDKRVVIVDHSGVVADALVQAANARNEMQIFRGEGDERKQVAPRFVIERVEPEGDPLKQSLALSDRVRTKDMFAFLVVEKDLVEATDPSAAPRINYHSESPTDDAFLDWVYGPLGDRVRELRLAKANVDLNVVRDAIRSPGVANLGLVSVDASGNIKPAERTNRLANFLVPMAAMMLMLMVTMIGASPLVQSTIEEKMQRIVEVLLGSITPFELMLGKLLGMVGVSLTMGAVYLAGGYASLKAAGFVEFFPTHLLVWFIVFQALAVLMYGSLFIAIGAAVTDLKESQSMMLPVTLLVMAPMFVWGNVLKEPNATFAVVTSLFPPATPMLMILRQSIPPGVPAWQPALGVGLVLLTTLLLVWAAGRIFRVGVLMQGRGAKFGEMLRWVARG